MILALRTYALYLTNFWLYCLGCLIVFPTLTALFMMLWVYGKYIIGKAVRMTKLPIDQTLGPLFSSRVYCGLPSAMGRAA